VTSADARFAGYVPLEVTVTVTDDDPVITPIPLPLAYGGPWDPLPTGFQGTGLGTPYASSLGGDTNSGSAKFDSNGDQLVISLNAAPLTLSYQLEGNPSTTGTFAVQESQDGITFTTVRTVTDKTSADQAFSDSLLATTRFVKFLYVSKVSGNIQLDKIAISAAPPFAAWASTFGLAGADAAMENDYDGDGLSNLAEYDLGSSPVSVDSAGYAPALAYSAQKLQLTANVRSSDAALAVSAQTSADITTPASWTSAGVSAMLNVDQTGVPSGFSRVTFEVDTTGGTQRFFRLAFTLK
jgi:hypothetical protein